MAYETQRTINILRVHDYHTHIWIFPQGIIFVFGRRTNDCILKIEVVRTFDIIYIKQRKILYCINGNIEPQPIYWLIANQKHAIQGI